VVGFEALRRQTAREFPEAVPGKISLPKSLSRDRGAAPATPEDARLDRLGRLAELHTQGVLSDEEFDREKARILETTGAAAS
jgi:predicted Zn-dependent peptidase